MTKETPVQPTLTDLLAGYLQRQADAQAAGLAAVDSSGEVTPFEAGPVQPIEAPVAWEEATAVLTMYGGAGSVAKVTPPPQWPQLVAAQEPILALPLAVGNFPQLVRHFHLLLHPSETFTPPATNPRAILLPELLEWAKQVIAKPAFPRALLALGALRLARQFAMADNLIAATAAVPAAWRAAWANEKAALAWQRGQRDEAMAQWQSQEASVPVLFNRGMAALFLQRAAAARAALTQAVAQLPETDGWHHLGRLYLALAETK